MSEASQIERYVRHMDEVQSDAREAVLDALIGEADGDEHRLIRWMVEKTINPAEVFVTTSIEKDVLTYVGLRILMDNIYAGLVGHRDMVLVQTACGHPYVVFQSFGDEEMHAYLIKMRGPDTLFKKNEDDLRPVKVLANLDEYMVQFEDHARGGVLMPVHTLQDYFVR